MIASFIINSSNSLQYISDIIDCPGFIKLWWRVPQLNNQTHIDSFFWCIFILEWFDVCPYPIIVLGVYDYGMLSTFNLTNWFRNDSLLFCESKGIKASRWVRLCGSYILWSTHLFTLSICFKYSIIVEIDKNNLTANSRKLYEVSDFNTALDLLLALGFFTGVTKSRKPTTNRGSTNCILT